MRISDWSSDVCSSDLKIDTRPGTGMYSPWGPWGWSPYYGRYWGRSWYDPFWGPWGWDQPEVYSYTVYSSFLSMKIMRTGGGDRVFEGRAETQTRWDDLTTLVPNLEIGRATWRERGFKYVENPVVAGHIKNKKKH